MGFGVKMMVWGDYACFTRPEMKVERVSYDTMTPSAARGILSAVYWKPAIRWVIDAIVVVNPIKFEPIRRNELLGKISMQKVQSAFTGKAKEPLMQVTSQNIVQRSSLLLKDVRYIIEAHFELTEEAGETDTEEKHYNIALRRLRKGQCFAQPYLGCREFGASFTIIEDGEEPISYYQGTEKDLGYMLWDLDYQHEATPLFFRASMKNGRILVPELHKEEFFA